MRFNASSNLWSLQQSEMRIYRFPLFPKINPGVMNTRALCNTFSVNSSTSAQLSGIFPQRNIPTCFSSYVHPSACMISLARWRRLR